MSLFDTIMSKKLNMIIIEQYVLPGFILSGDLVVGVYRQEYLKESY